LAGEHGLRRAEIAVVHTADLIPASDGFSLRVHGKGGKTRIVPLSDQLAYHLARHPDGYLFPGDIDGHLSPRRVAQLARMVLPAEWTLHKLRHMFATRAYAVSHDLVSVQELLGHVSIATTRAYVAKDQTALRTVVNAVAARSFTSNKDQSIRAREEQSVTVDIARISSDQAVQLIALLSSKVEVPNTGFG
ncbi:MAG: tyrosine-type recombinase/integrase, partial [Leucobacter sp.]|nr:tyrosine-type recombinase/integrase [Leucobacter sp.]